jgi:hypothetical protein
MAPQTPAPPVVQEIPSEPEQNLSPVQGIRHEVSTRAQFCYPLLSMKYPDSAISPFQDQNPPLSSPLVMNDPAAETGTQNQALSEEIQARLKEIFAWLQKDARDQIRDVDYFEGMLEPISQKLPKDIKTLLEPISGLDIHYVAIRRALKSVSSRPAVEQKKAKAEQAVKGAQSQT